MIQALNPFDANSSPVRHVVRRCAQPLDSRSAHGIVGVAHINAYPAPSRNHVRGAWFGQNLARRCDEVRRPARKRLDSMNPLRGRRNGVTSPVHRRRACMPCLPNEGDGGCHPAGDCIYNRERAVATVEDRSLLDVKLDISECIRSCPRLIEKIWIEAEAFRPADPWILTTAAGAAQSKCWLRGW